MSQKIGQLVQDMVREGEAAAQQPYIYQGMGLEHMLELATGFKKTFDSLCHKLAEKVQGKEEFGGGGWEHDGHLEFGTPFKVWYSISEIVCAKIGKRECKRVVSWTLSQATAIQDGKSPTWMPQSSQRHRQKAK